jgi:hypothetical protein
MRGNIDETFFEKINGVFICLVVSSIRHCLKCWVTGVYVQPSKNEHFMYQTAISEFISYRHTGQIA